jgi:hypothetical protein
VSFGIRPATMLDIWRLRPVLSRRAVAVFGLQLAGTDARALVRGDGPLAGEVFAAGGLYLDREAGERVCWMVVGTRPPARDLVAGVRLVIAAAGPGDPVRCEVDADNARDVRFAEFLGFRALSSASPDTPNLPARILRMELI